MDKPLSPEAERLRGILQHYGVAYIIFWFMRSSDEHDATLDLDGWYFCDSDRNPILNGELQAITCWDMDNLLNEVDATPALIDEGIVYTWEMADNEN